MRKKGKVALFLTIAAIISSGILTYTYLTVLSELKECLESTLKTLEIGSVKTAEKLSLIEFNISLTLKNIAKYNLEVEKIQGEICIDSVFIGRLTPSILTTSFTVPANSSCVISLIFTNSNYKVTQMIRSDKYTIHINGTITGYISCWLIKVGHTENFNISYSKN